MRSALRERARQAAFLGGTEPRAMRVGDIVMAPDVLLHAFEHRVVVELSDRIRQFGISLAMVKVPLWFETGPQPCHADRQARAAPAQNWFRRYCASRRRPLRPGSRSRPSNRSLSGAGPCPNSRWSTRSRLPVGPSANAKSLKEIARRSVRVRRRPDSAAHPSTLRSFTASTMGSGFVQSLPLQVISGPLDAATRASGAPSALARRPLGKDRGPRGLASFVDGRIASKPEHLQPDFRHPVC
jgi:hypothetical protein